MDGGVYTFFLFCMQFRETQRTGERALGQRFQTQWNILRILLNTDGSAATRIKVF